ncbi:Meiotic expression up-regulated protein 10 [Smittium mucronatum]|uniref:Meiotic expression up-regulated protein 10 n=1 Tax=Smittium mucronatum TaxID=133383 RepID=A0A1R0H1N0_9FUNG|nr:Meiotic expression up-regulated protein 10 [Smittium mucronatum]
MENSLRNHVNFYQLVKVNGLRIKGIEYGSIVFHNLKWVNGDFLLNGGSENTIGEFPELIEIQGYARVEKMGRIQMDKISTVQGIFILEDNYFSSISLPKLEKVYGSFKIVGKNLLETIDLKSLKNVGGVLLIENGEMSEIGSLDLSSLETVALDSHIEGHYKSLDLPKLVNIGGWFSFLHWGKHDCKTLEDLFINKAEKVVCFENESQMDKDRLSSEAILQKRKFYRDRKNTHQKEKIVYL